MTTDIAESLPLQVDGQTNDDWFNELVSTIRVHQLQLSTGTADDSLKSMYSVLFNGNTDKMALLVKNQSSQYFVTRSLVSYIKEILKRKLPVHTLAVDLSDSNILVWSVIEDDDEITETELYLAQALINSHFLGVISITTTVVEKSDKFEVPSHYQVILPSVA